MTPGGTLISSYIRRLGPFLGVQIFEFLYYLGVFRKMNNFWGLKILWIFLGGQRTIGQVLGAIYMHLGSFLKVKIENIGDVFGVY